MGGGGDRDPQRLCHFLPAASQETRCCPSLSHLPLPTETPESPLGPFCFVLGVPFPMITRGPFRRGRLPPLPLDGVLGVLPGTRSQGLAPRDAAGEPCPGPAATVIVGGSQWPLISGTLAERRFPGLRGG